jgi:hypothetical protein
MIFPIFRFRGIFTLTAINSGRPTHEFAGDNHSGNDRGLRYVKAEGRKIADRLEKLKDERGSRREHHATTETQWPPALAICPPQTESSHA